MRTIQVPARDTVSSDAQIQFDIIQKRMDKAPGLYATMGSWLVEKDVT